MQVVYGENEIKLSAMCFLPLVPVSSVLSHTMEYNVVSSFLQGDYLRRVSYWLATLELKQKQKLLQPSASIQHHQVQMGSHMRPVNAVVHAIIGGNSSITAQVPSISTQGRQPSQLQGLPMTSLVSSLETNQNVACPLAQNMHVKVKQEHPEVTRKPDQTLNSRQASTTPSAPSVQLSQQMVAPVASEKLKELALQMQPSDFSGCNPNRITQPQGQPVQPNVQQNPFGKNGMLPKELMMVNQKGLGFNQQQTMDRQKYQMQVHNGHLGAQNTQPGVTIGLGSKLRMHEQEALNEHIEIESQPVALPQQLITASQQNILFCKISQTLGFPTCIISPS